MPRKAATQEEEVTSTEEVVDVSDTTSLPSSLPDMSFLTGKFSDEQIEKLNTRAPDSEISQREAGRGMLVSYLESHYVQRTANNIFGYGQWETEIVELRERAWTDKNNNEKFTFTAIIRVTVRFNNGNSTSQTDVGVATTRSNTDDAFDMAIKGAVSDGEKRCLRKFGDAFGLFLYDKDNNAEASNNPAPVAAPRPAPAARAPAAPAPRPAPPVRPTTSAAPANNGQATGNAAVKLAQQNDPDRNTYQCEEMIEDENGELVRCGSFADGYIPRDGNTYITTAHMIKKSQALGNNAGKVYCPTHYRKHYTQEPKRN